MSLLLVKTGRFFTRTNLFISDAGNGSRIPRPPFLFGLYLWYMKILITENQLEKFIKDKLGLDLGGKIHMVTNKDDLPKEFMFIYWGGSQVFNKYLNLYGPMYVIESPYGNFMYQNRNGKIDIFDTEYNHHSERDVLKALGINPLWGFGIDDLINIYF